MRPLEEILIKFQQGFQEKKEIKLINVYKGFPISYPGTILSVGKKDVKIKTEPFQVVCMYLDKETYIQSDLFPAVIRANITSLEFNKLEGTLSSFRYVVGGIGDRTQVRVEPKEPLQGTVESKERHTIIRAELADLSLEGLAVYMEPQLFSPRLYYKGADVLIHLKLPDVRRTAASGDTESDFPADPDVEPRFSHVRNASVGLPKTEYPAIYSAVAHQQNEFILMGTIANVREESLYKRIRLGIQLNTQGPSRAFISEFLLQRQTEILREIRGFYHALLQIETHNQ